MSKIPLGFDPRASEIESIATGPALSAQALSFLSLEQIFNRAKGEPDFPSWAPELLRDRRRPDFDFTPETATPAAVLMALVGEASLRMILTRRTNHLSAHAGQISFPGGRSEASDADAAGTALREAEEEIGLASSRMRVLGTLPDYITVTGFRVSPVIGWAPEAGTLTPDPSEVADVFTVPLSFLMNPANHQVRIVSASESPTGELIRFYAMPFVEDGLREEQFIWGATAAMIRNLYHFLSAAVSEMDREAGRA